MRISKLNLQAVVSIIIAVIFLQSNPLSAQWTQMNSGVTTHLYSIHFPTKNYGYAGSLNGVICKTTNGGANWTNGTYTSSSYMTGIFFTSDSVGYAVGSGAKILKTTNAGTNWTTILNSSTQIFNGVYFPSNNTGYIVGNLNTILKTTNAGINWDDGHLDNLGSSDYYSVHFINNNTGWICGVSGLSIIRKTTDGGDNWITQFVGTGTQPLRSIKFRNANVGVAVGDNGMIYRTTNGGDNWSTVASGETTILFSIDMAVSGSANSWYIAGGGGKLLKSTDNGATWIQLNSGIGTSMYSVSVRNQDTVYMSGAGGIMLKSFSGGLTSVPVTTNTPEQYSLTQNYPNPFNPSTTIMYDIPKSTFVKIKVYDVTGKEVSVLLNEQKQAGSYEVSFNASELSSGVYFYRIETENFTEMKKMLLVK